MTFLSINLTLHFVLYKAGQNLSWLSFSLLDTLPLPLPYSRFLAPVSFPATFRFSFTVPWRLPSASANEKEGKQAGRQKAREGELSAKRGETDAITECRNAYNHRRYRRNAEAAARRGAARR